MRAREERETRKEGLESKREKGDKKRRSGGEERVERERERERGRERERERASVYSRTKQRSFSDTSPYLLFLLPPSFPLSFLSLFSSLLSVVESLPRRVSKGFGPGERRKLVSTLHMVAV